MGRRQVTTSQIAFQVETNAGRKRGVQTWQSTAGLKTCYFVTYLMISGTDSGQVHSCKSSLSSTMSVTEYHESNAASSIYIKLPQTLDLALIARYTTCNSDIFVHIRHTPIPAFLHHFKQVHLDTCVFLRALSSPRPVPIKIIAHVPNIGHPDQPFCCKNASTSLDDISVSVTWVPADASSVNGSTENGSNESYRQCKQFQQPFPIAAEQRRIAASSAQRQVVELSATHFQQHTQ